MKNILRKIRQLMEKKFSLMWLLNITNIGYNYRMVADQYYIRRRSSSNLVRFRPKFFPRLGIVAKEFTSLKERQKNLELVVKCLEAAGVEYFVIPEPYQDNYKVGVLAEDRNKFLNELRKQRSNKGTYITKINKLQKTFTRRQIISNRRSLNKYHDADIVRVYSFTLSPAHDVLAGELDGCNVEFWERSNNLERREYLEKKIIDLRVNIELDLLTNVLIAPADNIITGILPLDEVKASSITIGGKKYRTYDVFSEKTIYDIDFPVDIVYAWVDGNDSKWKAKFNKYKGVNGSLGRNNTESRYVDRQELKYSLRSIHMYAPFVRNIYIVTDDQIPEWLDESVPGVKIIDHKEIFSDPSVLPVFNSHAIGSQVHHIKGLSDRYLYLNDDMMFGKLITPHKFFHSSGIALVPASPALIHAGSPKDYEPAPSSAGKNVRKAIEESLGRYITHKFRHSPNPQIKEVAYEIEKKYSEVVSLTAGSRFRSKTDVQFASLFHHNYSLITGRAVRSNLKSTIVNISQEDGTREALNLLVKTRDSYTVCLNESETLEERKDEVEKMVHEFFERYYPYPSPWEKTK